MERRERELDSWDALVKETIDSLHQLKRNRLVSSIRQTLCLSQKGSAQAPTLLKPTFFAFREWQDLQQKSLEEEEETTLVETQVGSKQLCFCSNHQGQCKCSQCYQHGLQRSERYHLFQLWQEGSRNDKDALEDSDNLDNLCIGNWD